jgi:23S rRNA (uracil1939-C5)-methyltransferase
VRLKQSSLERQFSQAGLSYQSLKVIPANERFHYRNRVQLHYRYQYLGFINAIDDQIVEVPECKLLDEGVKKAVEILYTDKPWVLEEQSKGHCEIYNYGNEVKVTWNSDYANEGFTQVNSAMNDVLKAYVKNESSKIKYSTLLDVFSGKGNLSDDLLMHDDQERFMADYSSFDQENFYQMDLYDEGAARRLKRIIKKDKIDLLLLDPPRKGLPDIQSWVALFKPKLMIYVSCNFQTMIRDLKSIERDFTVVELAMIDMFPGTHHFETVAVIKFD